MRTLVFLCTGILVMSLASPSDARPYTVVARYGPAPTSIDATLTLASGMEIPDAGHRRDLQHLAIHFESKPFGLFPAQAFDGFEVTVAVEGVPCAPGPIVVKLDQLESGGDFNACLWQRSRNHNSGVINAQLTVKARLSKDLLCAIEARHRDLEGSPLPAAAATAARGTVVSPYADRGPTRKLTLDGDTLFASYCYATNWDDAAAVAGAGKASELEISHKKALFAMIQPEIAKFFSRWTTFDQSDPGAITERFDIVVFRTGEIFGAYESSPDGKVLLSNVVDRESDISFSGTHDSGYCPAAQRAPFRYTVGVVGDDSSVVEVKPSFMENCEFRLPIDLGKLNGQRLRVRALYDVDGGDSIVLYEREFTAHELGFSWSVPGFSELRAVVNGWSKDEFRAQSSLPLSWAVGVGGAGDGVALTIPAKITYATRKNPDLAKMFTFYPHLSVVVTDADAGETPVTLTAGVGIGLVNSFYFSYALGFTGPHDGDHFILIGLDIKDLAGLNPSF